mgnify:FL=1
MITLSKRDMRSIMSGYGSWSDMTMTLPNGMKILVPEKYTKTERKRQIVNQKIKSGDFSDFKILAN